jgi:integrase
MTSDEATKLLVTVKGSRLEALYAVALALGLRRGEALAVRWDDLDLVHGTLSVKRTLVRVNGKLIFNEPKTERSARTIPLPSSCVMLLKSHRARQVQERLAVGPRWQENGLVFATTIGTPIEPRNLNRDFHRRCEEAGLRRFRLHDLRHTCASLLLAQGVPARVVMEILGHSGISITLNTYSHVSPAIQQEALDKMNHLLEGAAQHPAAPSAG